MKLLRLTSEREDGVFDGFLKQELDIPEKSQIALQSAVVETENQKLKIDTDTDTFTFRTANATPEQSIRFEHTDGIGTRPDGYDSTNVAVFFDDFTNKVNSQFRLATTSANHIGKQFRVTTHQDGKVEATFQSSAYNSRRGELQANIHNTTVNGANNQPGLTVAVAQDAIGSASNTNNITGANKYNFRTHYNFPITRSCGVVRAQIRRFIRDDAARSGGFTMCLSAKTPAQVAANGFLDADIYAGIQVLEMDAAGTAVYTSVQDGVATNSALLATQYRVPGAATGDIRNDHIEIAITASEANINAISPGRVCQMNVYRRANDVDAAPTFAVNTLATRAYATDEEAGIDLYGYIFIHGAVAAGGGGAFNIRLQTPRFTSDPFLEAANNNNQLRFIENEYDTVSLGAKPEPPRNRNTIHSIAFASSEVSEWLGFSSRQPAPVTMANGIAEFKADDLFGSKVIADAFIVQLLNLPVESYDAHVTKESRENILAVIPAHDDQNRVLYEPNSLLFLDLANKYPIKLSNLKLRIVRQDYSGLETRGLNSVVLIIKSP